MGLFDSLSYTSDAPPPPPLPGADPLDALLAQRFTARSAPPPTGAPPLALGVGPVPEMPDSAGAGGSILANLLNTPGLAKATTQLRPVPRDLGGDAGPYWRATLAPLSEGDDGQKHFDATAGLLGMAGDVIPSMLRAGKIGGDIATGQVDPTSQEGIRRIADAAMTFGMGGLSIPKPAGALGIAGGNLARGAAEAVPTIWNDAALDYLGGAVNEHNMLAEGAEEAGNHALQMGHDDKATTLFKAKEAGPGYDPGDDAHPALVEHLARANQLNAPPAVPASAPAAVPTWNDRALDFLRSVGQDHRDESFAPREDDAYRAQHGSIADAVLDMKREGPGYEAPAGSPGAVPYLYRRASEMNEAPVPEMPDVSLEAKMARLLSGQPIPAAPSDPSRTTAAIAARYPEDVPSAPRVHPALAAHADQVGMTPQQFADRMFGEGHRLNSVYGDANGMVLDAHLPNGSYVKRNFLPDGSVYHAYFEVPKEVQGDGTSKAILQSQIPLYQDMGRTRVDVHANIDVGGYSWGRYGFVPTQSSWNRLRSEALTKLDAVKDQVPERVYSRMKAAAADSDPRALWEMVDSDTPIRKGSGAPAPTADASRLKPHDMGDEDFNFAQMLDKMRAQTAADLPGQPVPGYVPLQRAAPPGGGINSAADVAANPKNYHSLGKQLFLGSNWHGSLDLRDPTVMQRFRDYAGR